MSLDSKSYDTINSENYQKVLVLSSRKISGEDRHFLKELELLIPTSKHENKFNMKKSLFELNELIELNSCSHCVYLETSKNCSYIWFSNYSGSSMKFKLINSSSSSTINALGNFSISSRPIISIDSSIQKLEHGNMICSLFSDIFSLPANTKKAHFHKFFDHVIQISYLDDKFWLRNYEISSTNENNPIISKDGISLIEIGPRFVLELELICQGSFCGKILYNSKTKLKFNDEKRVKNLAKRTKFLGKKASKGASATNKKLLFKHSPEDLLK